MGHTDEMRTADWEGYAERECGDHRTTGGRAWCFDCSEWCYDHIPCKGCELPRLRALTLSLGLHLTALCNHPTNYEHRYEVAEGRPCAGCYDARDAFEKWADQAGLSGSRDGER